MEDEKFAMIAELMQEVAELMKPSKEEVYSKLGKKMEPVLEVDSISVGEDPEMDEEMDFSQEDSSSPDDDFKKRIMSLRK